jgi:hypothetical protein
MALLDRKCEYGHGKQRYTDCLAKSHRAGDTGKGTLLPHAEIGFVPRMMLLLMLLVELVLGIAVNLAYARLPETYASLFSGSGPGSYPLLVTHILVGYLLGVLAIGFTLLLAPRGHTLQTYVSAVGVVAVILAGASGDQFLMAGELSGWSLAMTLAFFGALVIYLLIERSTRPIKTRTPRGA